ncbi:glycosyltransferase family 39 protein [Nocardioides marmoraquaticus]
MGPSVGRSRLTVERGALLLVLVTGFVLSFLGSWQVSLWTDESVTVAAARRSWPQLADLLGDIDAVHGTYYGFMKVWTAVAGSSEVALRVPSAVAAALTAVGVLVLARRVATPGTAVAAGLLCAVLPRMTWAGIEARPFAFSALVAVWATWALVVALDRGGASRWVRYGVLAALGVTVNIYLVMVVMGHALTALLLARGRWRRVTAYFATAVTVAVVTLPVLLLVRSQQGQLGGGTSTAPAYVLRRVLVNQVFLGETPLDGVYGRVFDLAWQAAAVLAALVALAVALAAVVRHSRPGDLKPEVLAVALPWMLLPTTVVAAYAILVDPLYQPRYLTFTVPAVALLLALGLRSLGRRWIASGALAVLLVCSATVYVSQRLEYSKSGSDWAVASAVIARCAQPGDDVLYEPRSLDGSDARTSRRIADAYESRFAGLRDLTLVRSGARAGTLDGDSAPLPDVVSELGDARVWVLFGRTHPPDVIERDSAVLRDEGYVEVGQWRGPHTTVREYQPGTMSPVPALPRCADDLPGAADAMP